MITNIFKKLNGAAFNQDQKNILKACFKELIEDIYRNIDKEDPIYNIINEPSVDKSLLNFWDSPKEDLKISQKCLNRKLSKREKAINRVRRNIARNLYAKHT